MAAIAEVTASVLLLLSLLLVLLLSVAVSVLVSVSFLLDLCSTLKMRTAEHGRVWQQLSKLLHGPF